MTDHDLDRIAYEACYPEAECIALVDGEWRKVQRYATRDGDFEEDDVVLAPWSSTDAAIAHAERGGFNWLARKRVKNDDTRDEPLPPGAHITSVFIGTGDFDKDEPVFFGYADNPGLAIRNAIVAHAKGGE